MSYISKFKDSIHNRVYDIIDGTLIPLYDDTKSYKIGDVYRKEDGSIYKLTKNGDEEITDLNNDHINDVDCIYLDGSSTINTKELYERTETNLTKHTPTVLIINGLNQTYSEDSSLVYVLSDKKVDDTVTSFYFYRFYIDYLNKPCISFFIVEKSGSSYETYTEEIELALRQHVHSTFDIDYDSLNHSLSIPVDVYVPEAGSM